MARPTLFLHRKLNKLGQRLQSRALAIGTLELLWHAANESGDPILGDVIDVEGVADWRGAPGALVTALMECGTAGGGAGFLIRRTDGRYEIHDYWDHAPDYVRKRARREQSRRENGAQMKADRDRSRPENDRSDGGVNPQIDRSAPNQGNGKSSPQDGRPVTDRSNESGDTQLTGQNAVGSLKKGDFGRTPTPTPTPTPARKEEEEEFTHTQRAREADRSGQTGVRQFGTALCEIGGNASESLGEWQRSVPEVNAEAFSSWIVHWERNKARRMAPDVRLLQARDLGKRGDHAFQAALVEHCMRQDWGSLITNSDYIRQTNGRGGADRSSTPRKSRAELEIEDVWRRHRAGETESHIAREALTTVERVREILAQEEPHHAVG